MAIRVPKFLRDLLDIPAPVEGQSLGWTGGAVANLPTASTAALSAHTGATAAHGVAGALVGTSDAQGLSNKTISASSFTGNLPVSGNVNAGSLTGRVVQSSFVDASGTPGNVTVNALTGFVAFATGARDIVVTNSFVTGAHNLIHARLCQAGDSVAIESAVPNPAGGSFTVGLTGAVSAPTKCWFSVEGGA